MVSGFRMKSKMSIKGWKLSAFMNYVLGVRKRRILSSLEQRFKMDVIGLLHSNKAYSSFNADKVFRTCMAAYSLWEAINRGEGIRKDKKRGLVIYCGEEPEINLFDKEIRLLLRKKLVKELKKISQTYQKIPPEMPVHLRIGGVIWKTKK